MNGRDLSLLVLCMALPLGCSKKDDAKGGDAKAADAKAGDAKSGDAKAGDVKAGDAAGDAKAGGTATACPTAPLSGRDQVDRVITKDCGVVQVAADYAVEGTTLTLEAGATLAFADGAKLEVGLYESSKLIVKGTAQAPVTLTSSGDKTAGVWQGVRLHDKANRSSLQGLVLEHAGTDDEAALVVEAQDVSIGGSTVRSAKSVGIEISGDGRAKVAGTTLAELGPIAMRVTPVAAGDIAADNEYPAGAVVQVKPGALAKSAQWNALGTPWLIGGQVVVNGAGGQRANLTLAPGAELRFGSEGNLEVGLYEDAGLVAEGSADKRIVFTAHERQEAGAWSGVRLFGKAEARLQHVTFSYGGKQEADGALLIDGPARVTLQDASFTDDVVGVVVQGTEAKVQVFDRVAFERTPVALRAAARYVSALGTGNVYGPASTGEPRIVAEADKLDADASWKPQAGAKLELEGLLQISGTRLVVEAGTTVWVADGVEVQVGLYENAGLELRGNPEAPVTFRGVRDESGTWGGIVLFAKAKGNVLENVVLRNAGGQAGVRFDGESDGKIKGLRCDTCSSPGLTWTCSSRVEHAEIVAGEGTPKDYDEPSCN